MKAKQQKGELKRLLTGDRTLQTLFQVFRKKDYNRIGHRLRNYQSLVLFLQSPTLSDMRDLEKINTNMRDLDVNIKEIGLAIDEMVEDWEWLGLSVFAEVLTSLMDMLRTQYENISREAKERLVNNRNQHIKFKKRSMNVCEECTENHEATHLKRLKTSFGLLYPQAQGQLNRFEIPIEKEDLALKEKQDFIDQLNLLLNKQPSIASLTVNTSKYKQLVNCLSKMEKIDNQLSKRNKRTIIKDEEYNQIFQDAADNQGGLQSKYNEIIEEVKRILNGKFREGYSHRIRSMLDKFQIVLKADHRKPQPKIIINTRDEEIQTLQTSQGTQIIILKEEIIKRDVELNGIKEGRKKIEEKYLRLLESERKVSREATSLYAKVQKLTHELQTKQKQIQYFFNLFRELQIMMGKKRPQKKIDLFGTNQAQNNRLSKTSDYRPMGVEKKLSNDSYVRFAEKQQKNTTTQTDIQSESNFQPKKKNHKIIKRFSILPNSNHTINNYSDVDLRPYRIVTVLNILVEPSLVPPSRLVPSRSIEDLLNQSQKELKKVGRQTKKAKKQHSKKKNENQKENGNGSGNGNGNENGNAKANVNVKVNRPNLGMKYNKSIEILRKEDADEIILERSQKSFASQSSLPRSSIFNPRASRESRDFKNMNLIRLAEFPKQFRLNHLKTDTSKTKDESIYQSTTIREKDSIVRINKYEKKYSNNLDRDRVKEIVNLLKVQKESISRRKPTIKHIDPSERMSIEEDRPKIAAQLAQIQISLKEQEKEELIETKQDITETIQSLKILIQSQYTYLKASGFINFLLNFEKKPSLVNRSLIKYKFQFTHISQNQLHLFGGAEEMVKFTQNQGVWQRYIIDENDLKIYYKHINFAHKISKYFILLKKMNHQYFQEYVNFITDPLNFSLNHFSPETVQTINSMFPQSDRQEREVLASNQLNWKKIMMRLIRFHHQMHKNCKHIVQFLDKIGYYRYSI